MLELLDKVGRVRKFLAGIVGALLGVGVVALVPGIDPGLAATITGGLSSLAVVLGPANDPKTPVE